MPSQNTCKLALALAFLICRSATAEEVRQWMAGQFSERAQFVSLKEKVVTLRLENGDEVEVDMELLSQSDRDYVRAATEQAQSASPFRRKPRPSADPKSSGTDVGQMAAESPSGSFRTSSGLLVTKEAVDQNNRKIIARGIQRVSSETDPIKVMKTKADMEIFSALFQGALLPAYSPDIPESQRKKTVGMALKQIRGQPIAMQAIGRALKEQSMGSFLHIYGDQVKTLNEIWEECLVNMPLQLDPKLHGNAIAAMKHLNKQEAEELVAAWPIAADLPLNGISELSPEAAQALAEHPGPLLLSGLTAISRETAAALAKHGGAVHLNGLSTLSLEAAGELAKHKGELQLRGLVELPKMVTDVLASHDGPVQFDGRHSKIVSSRKAPINETNARDIGMEAAVVNSVGITLALIPSGEFAMGEGDERLVHRVAISRPFYIGIHEVTNAQWKQVMGTAPSRWTNSDRPVEMVTWNDAVMFCKKLSDLPAERAAGYVYRLPTEAEWEYACRAGTDTKYSFGDDENLLGEYAWFGANSGNETHPVGLKKPNKWGLYDMHGNVFEWCAGHYDHRGGGILTPGSACLSTSRFKSRGKADRHDRLGLRVVMTFASNPPQQPDADVAEPYKSSAVPVTPIPNDPREKQDEAARELGVGVSLVNAVGMRLVLVPAGTFAMGDKPPYGSGKDMPRHEVTISKPFYMGIHEVTNAQWKTVMGATPSKSSGQGDQQPVETLNWDDAVNFCRHLSGIDVERQAGRVYRLPTEAEWEYACRAGTETQYSWGDDDQVFHHFIWCSGNTRGETKPVGQLKPNSWGLYDMHGNVWEWCSDWYGSYGPQLETDPQGPPSGTSRVCRGGSVKSACHEAKSARRHTLPPVNRRVDVGFRVVVSLADSVSQKGEAAATETPSPLRIPVVLNAESARRKQNEAAIERGVEVSLTNSVGMQLVLVPAGTFTMGDGKDGASPAHDVTISKPFYMGVHEVTNAQWKSVMGTIPFRRKDDLLPVEQVNWDDAVGFCRKLSDVDKEKQAGRVYRLPTEAEWEYACRAGTHTQFYSGDDVRLLVDCAWCDANSGGQSHPVGQKRPNAWGLCDMHGNVSEWCSDWFGSYSDQPVVDPKGFKVGSFRVNRGGCWRVDAEYCRSAARANAPPSSHLGVVGFRVVVSLADSVSQKGEAAAAE